MDMGKYNIDIKVSPNSENNEITNVASVPKTKLNLYKLIQSDTEKKLNSPLMLSGRKRRNMVNSIENAPSPLLRSDNTRGTSGRFSRNKRKYATREIAALDFLKNIPMAMETTKSPKHIDCEKVVLEDGFSIEETQAGRRMPGHACTRIQIPDFFRYRLKTKFPSSSTVVRRWERLQLNKNMLKGRMFMAVGQSYPVAVISIIKYDNNQSRKTQTKNMDSVDDENDKLLEKTEEVHYDWRGTSYDKLLHSTWARCDKFRDKQDDHVVYESYDPLYLDDPAFKQGRHRQVIQGDSNIGPVVSSILSYVKPRVLKEELNSQFREMHPNLHADLTLSKIRNLKLDLLGITRKLKLEIATCAIACVCFEKLVLKKFVSKENRKLAGAVCFFLAIKFNAPKPSDSIRLVLKKVLEEIDRALAISSEEILAAEMAIFAELDFNLHIPLYELQSHFTRLLKSIEFNPRKYLDSDLYTEYMDALAYEQSMQKNDSSSEDLQYSEDEKSHLDLNREDSTDSVLKSENSIFSWQGLPLAQWLEKKMTDRLGRKSKEALNLKN